MFAISNKLSRSKHSIDLIAAGNSDFFSKLPFTPAPKPDLKTIVHLFRGILSLIHHESLSPTDVNTIYIERLKIFTGHKTRDNKTLLLQLPWLKYLTITSDEIINDEEGLWTFGTAPITKLGFSHQSNSVLKIQLHEDSHKYFGFVEGGNFTKIDPTKYIGFKTIGSIEFYERCASYAFLNKPWTAEREEILRIFDISEKKDFKRFKKYEKWNLFRQFLSKKCSQLESRGIKVVINNILNSSKDEFGIVQSIVFNCSRSKTNPKLQLVVSNDELIEATDRVSFLHYAAFIDEGCSDRIRKHLLKFDDLIASRAIDNVSKSFRFKGKELYYMSKTDGPVLKKIGALYSAVINQTRGSNHNRESNISIERDSLRIEAELAYKVMLNEWTDSLYDEMTEPSEELESIIKQKENDDVWKITPLTNRQTIAKQILTGSKSKLLANLGCTTELAAINKLMNKIKYNP